jgi:hypothetical protein
MNNSLHVFNTRCILTDGDLSELIFDIFTRLENMMKAKQQVDISSAKVTYYFEAFDISEKKVPCLKSMLDYFERE